MQVIGLLFMLVITACSTRPNSYITRYDTYDPNSAYLIYGLKKSSKDISPANFYPVNLINVKGEVIHQWNAGCPIAHAKVYPGLKLYVACYLPMTYIAKLPPGNNGRIKILDKNSALLREYINIRIHHDFFRKDDNLLLLQTTPVSKKDLVKYGLKEGLEQRWADEIIEVDEKDKIVWRWSFFENNKPEYISEINKDERDLTHGNSVKFYQTNPFNNHPAVLVSFRNVSSIYLIDYITKEVLWKSPAGIVSYQHDASLIDNRRILVLDNAPINIETGSKIVEIDPLSNDLKVIFKHPYFVVPKQGAVQRTENGNYLITNSLYGYAFEINPNHKRIFSVHALNDHKYNISEDWIDYSPVFKVTKYDFLKLKNE